MTQAENAAWKAGVRAVLLIAQQSANRLRTAPWKPTHAGGISALDALAEEAEALLLGREEPPTLGAVPSAPKPVLPSVAQIAAE